MIPSATAKIGPAIRSVAAERHFADALDLSIHDSVQSLRQEWEALEQQSAISVYQRYQWIATYLEKFDRKQSYRPYIFVGRLDGEVVFILPMAMHGQFVRRLKFIGGTHVNFNIGIISPRYEGMLTEQCFEHIYRRLQRMLPGVGYIALCCQPETWLGKRNPVISSACQRTGNPAFVLDLTGGFEETLARGNAKRKRKKFRQQVRFAEERGGYELCIPNCITDINEAIDVFFEQKSRRLREMGIRDVFAEEDTKEFLKTLARRSVEMEEPLLQIYALKVGGETVAVFGGGFHERRFSGYFSSIADGGWEALSPGEMLLYLLVEHLCKGGCVQLDLGAGEERYKQSWSSERIEIYETLIPFNAIAIPVIWLRRIYGHLRRFVREDDRLWAYFKKLRRFKARLGI